MLAHAFAWSKLIRNYAASFEHDLTRLNGLTIKAIVIFNRVIANIRQMDEALAG